MYHNYHHFPSKYSLVGNLASILFPSCETETTWHISSLQRDQTLSHKVFVLQQECTTTLLMKQPQAPQGSIGKLTSWPDSRWAALLLAPNEVRWTLAQNILICVSTKREKNHDNATVTTTGQQRRDPQCNPCSKIRDWSRHTVVPTTF